MGLHSIFLRIDKPFLFDGAPIFKIYFDQLAATNMFNILVKLAQCFLKQVQYLTFKMLKLKRRDVEIRSTKCRKY